MGHVEVAHVSHVLPDGRLLLDDASFKIPDGATAAIVGPNGAGKTTLLRMIAGDLTPADGTVAASGGLGVMRQFVGGPQANGTTVRDLLLSVSPKQVREAAQLDDAELAMMERDDEPTQRCCSSAMTVSCSMPARSGSSPSRTARPGCTAAASRPIGPPEEPPREQHIKVRLRGSRTGRRAVMVEGLAVNGTTQPFGADTPRLIPTPTWPAAPRSRS